MCQSEGLEKQPATVSTPTVAGCVVTLAVSVLLTTLMPDCFSIAGAAGVVSSTINNVSLPAKRATKLVINLKKIPYKDRLMHLKLPTLKYRRLRGDMIEVFKIMHNIYDPEVSPELRYYPKSNTRGNKHKLLNHTFHYDTRKYSFIVRIVTFCVSRRRRKMYCGHARLCASVCLSAAVCPHYCTDPCLLYTSDAADE